ncbi:MAG: hypothetical protein IJY28_02950 [Clostridia bacterium]|nr:hypothetical protein [Clostridia bacterium]
MIRGVSRQIIEVKKTQNPYFERALFFVSPSFSDAERAAIEREAQRMLQELGEPTGSARRRRRWYLAVRMAGAAVGGGALASALLLLIL